ncbi:probable G-protein coupled receptor 82 [Polypterus senegalus]|uniref:probable G-protein coupled receptor 82 n=1 Tax=Polypterus senegalus TaxID=55291 RepID=UPI001964DD19|nr:probable G-protein coupled receptor 82 [Polypterus senegalus]XP_039601071.1 probable G-protein coupled receptor 82 [Polypterus senegalus]
MANDTNVTTCLHMSYMTSFALPFLYFVVFVVALPGNIISLWIFTKKMSITTPTHIYLINLTISNLLLCIILPFMFVYYIQGFTWKSSNFFYQFTVGLVTPVLHINIYISMVILTWIAFTRYAILVKQKKVSCYIIIVNKCYSGFLENIQKPKFAKIICCAVWVIAITGILPIVLFYAIIEAKAEENDDTCYSKKIETGGEASQISNFFGAALFFICFCLVLFSYMSLARHLNTVYKTTSIMGSDKIYKNVFRKLLLIQLVLAICFLPQQIFKIVFVKLVRKTTCEKLTPLVEGKNFVLWLSVSRCITDPIMYLMLDKTFQKNVCILIKVKDDRTTFNNLNGKIKDIKSLEEKRSKGTCYTDTHIDEHI